MKKFSKEIIVFVVAFVLGICLCCTFCCKKGTKVAVVDIQKIVAQPAAELRKDMQAQMSSLQEWVNTSNAEINKVSSEEQKSELTKKYQLELQQRQQLIQTDYAAKLQELDAKLTKIIENTAKKEGYNITLTKASTVAGGVDITDKVLAQLAK